MVLSAETISMTKDKDRIAEREVLGVVLGSRLERPAAGTKHNMTLCLFAVLCADYFNVSLIPPVEWLIVASIDTEVLRCEVTNGPEKLPEPGGNRADSRLLSYCRWWNVTGLEARAHSLVHKDVASWSTSLLLSQLCPSQLR